MKEKLQNTLTGIILDSIMKMKDDFREILNRKENGISITRQHLLLAVQNSAEDGETENLKITGEGSNKARVTMSQTSANPDEDYTECSRYFSQCS